MWFWSCKHAFGSQEWENSWIVNAKNVFIPCLMKHSNNTFISILFPSTNHFSYGTSTEAHITIYVNLITIIDIQTKAKITEYHIYGLYESWGWNIEKFKDNI